MLCEPGQVRRTLELVGYDSIAPLPVALRAAGLLTPGRPTFEPAGAGYDIGIPTNTLTTTAAPSCGDAELFRRWQIERDTRARDQLVERYLPLAKRLARRYARTAEPMDDLVQVASLALVKAVDRFDAGRPNGFVAYATPTILGELRRHFRDATWAVHVPRSIQERTLEVGHARRELSGRLGRSPTINELAQFMELDQELVLEAVQAAHAAFPTPLDGPRHDGEDEESLAATLGIEDERFELIELDASLAPAVRELSPRDRRILYLRIVCDLTQRDIAEQVGLSQMQISRILRRCVHALRAHADPDYAAAKPG